MKKISLTFCLALLSSLFCPAQVSPLQFNKNGEFKIVQFTDIHFKYGNPASDIALKRIGEVLDAECPDLVVFTGDVVYAAPADTAMRKVLSYATDRKIPFVVTFGSYQFYCFFQQNLAVYVLELTGSIGKMIADVAHIRRSQQCVTDSMDEHVCIRVPQQSLFMFQADTAQPKLAPCHQLVDIKAETYTYLHIVTSLS